MGKLKTTKRLVMAALFVALTFLATFLIQIPLPLGYIHLGDALVFLCGFILGPIWGTVAAGLGAGLADILSGYVIYAPATFVIKALMAFLAGLFYKIIGKALKKPFIGEVVAGVVGACVLAFGYFVYESILFTVESAAINILWNLLQGGVGCIAAVSIMQLPVMRKL